MYEMVDALGSSWQDSNELLAAVRKEYARSTSSQKYGLYARWGIYDFADEPVNFHTLAYQSIHDPYGDILDIGCSDGTTLLTHRLSAEHYGRLVGIDIHPSIFTFGKKINQDMNKQVLSPVYFVAADAAAMPFKDGSFAAASALFMLYHSLDHTKVLSEIKRVVMPLGRIAVTTSGSSNKSTQRLLEQRLASELGVQPPRHFNERFTIAIADKVLPKFFTIDAITEQHSNVQILPDTGEVRSPSYRAFVASLDSMRIHFQPVPSLRKWEQAKNRIVKPYIRNAFNSAGSLKEHVHRKLYVCRNNYI